MTRGRIVIAGAGAVGCFVGGLLAAAGHPVTLLGRPRMLDPIRDGGLRLTDFAGLDLRVAPGALELSETADCLAGAALVLVTVKGGATADMAARIAAHAPANAPVISLQNGIGNAGTLRAALPGRDLRAGMVPFNVVPAGPGHWHRASSGGIVIGAGPGDLANMLSVPGLAVTEDADITAIQWGKLLLNLNNALNALSGLALRDQLMSRGWRRLMADQMAEALGVLRASGIAVKSTTPLPAWMGPHILRLPTPLFARIAAQMLTIDPSARTSMAYDVRAGRATEIDQLQGLIVAMAAERGLSAPICAKVAGLVRSVTETGTTDPHLRPDALRP
ncbi:2-dehydropantoate 2-reductase [Antarcticimicrobium luteum]|uniref:2-dehydropantoate 2-reductase n=1 Tax=Antarcticimicrobium luteum TaxID=2547397 RepID=A0A4R5UT34_9RHOB|nr:2-dehydropantoate 2-reductase [Antarcticimicrobium luteum]TDK42201.1 2-dehydropantoate 2-reductase [Antarcticimicrobium luteum]